MRTRQERLARARERTQQLLNQAEAANARLEQRAGRNLPLAISTGLLLAAIFVASLVWHVVIFAVITSVAAGFACSEVALAVRRRDIWMPRAGIGVGGAIVPLSAYLFHVLGYGSWGVLWGVIAAWLLFVLWFLLERLFIAHSMRGLLPGLAFITYIAGGMGCAVALSTSPHGVVWVIAFVSLVICHDTGAYASGVLFGRHPMAPSISPHKTWEGQVGATVIAVAAGGVIAWLFLALPWWMGMILGFVFMLSATCGDLAESKLKRWIGVKDMSSWIPGHGGLLDRLDSIILTAPIALLAYTILMAFTA